jgi:hypothetical protein
MITASNFELKCHNVTRYDAATKTAEVVIERRAGSGCMVRRFWIIRIRWTCRKTHQKLFYLYLSR